MEKNIFKENDGIDEHLCLLMYNEDRDFYVMVLETFVNDLIQTSNRIRETFESNEKEQYKILVHGLKGAGGSAGAGHLVDLVTRSNDLMKEGRFDLAYEMHEEILAEMERLIKVIPERLEVFKES
ncbi:MAG: Hpt domain-containing protein [Lachnospiraceae bacterium]|nr:Hpt domain-containing protein [Lachnospiraceae bacterium]